jgi:hypothetical protein
MSLNASIRAPIGVIAFSGVLWGTSFAAMNSSQSAAVSELHMFAHPFS